jgi:uncharacterized membrane-anchored protein YjiN (DUF445 family)
MSALDSAGVESPEARRAGLRRMRTIATGLLVLMTAVFIATRFAPTSWIWASYVGAFAEAGMVGASADWFAVVALFRHPLGLPIPHTAIVPENKRRIGASMGRFIAGNFLSPRVAAERLRGIDFVGLAAKQLADARNVEAVTGVVRRLAPFAIAALPQESVEAWIGAVARRGAEALPVAPLASRALSILWANGAGQALLDQGLDLVEAALDRNKGMIVDQVKRQTSSWIPKWVDEIIAARLLHGLSGTLADMRRADHPWRAELDQHVETLVARLAHDPELRERGEALKREILDNPAFAEQARALWRELEGAIQRELPARAEAIAEGVIAALAALCRSIGANPAQRDRVNDAIRRMALEIVLPRRAEVGAYIAGVVDRWDTATLVTRLELMVGRDLQYIRINGTLVGGLVGLAIYAFTRAFGL